MHPSAIRKTDDVTGRNAQTSAPQSELMKEPIIKTARYLLVELAMYAVLAVIYFALVLRFLGPWLDGLFLQQRTYYVVVCILTMVGQAIALERLLAALSYLVRRGKK
jgi:hypothetical protein